ncbi:MAG TPA: RDD family protein [Leucothrix mucor]|nr:RDD family protein [Leucothrix mucor]
MTNPYQAPSSNVEQTEDSGQQSSIRYAGFWARAIAAAIDTIIWLIISLPLLYLFYGKGYFVQDINSAFILGPADAIINWILPIIIVLIFWVLKQATPGKILLKMKIIDVKTGRRPTMMQWIIRYVGYIPSTIVFLLGFIWVAWDKKKQAWHDKMAGTAVVFLS